MKTIILIIAAAIFVGNGYAQEKKCTCKKKSTAHRHKTTAAKKITQPTPSKTIYYSQSETILKDCPTNFECLFDSTTGNVQYLIKNSFSGYYPDVIETLHNPYRSLAVGSPAFDHYGAIPAKYTCNGQQASPPLTVRNIPADTRSLAIIMYDTHASTKGNHTYWMVWNVDTTGNIPENFVNDHMALNAANEYGYQPICPLAGTHYYHFAVYALDAKLRAGKRVSKAELESAMKGHILAKGELIGTYNKLVD
ncbi:MAG: hypothetical protein K0Q79_2149 [Flavipsychrobacter sp.]|jgi:Raf kinase inhibitor-like YbhB/YbcL family protein|nr:hypothetical protein [Flavipsychrobacter sp.]